MKKRRTKQAKIKANKSRVLPSVVKLDQKSVKPAIKASADVKIDQVWLVQQKYIKKDLGKSLFVTIILVILLFGIVFYLG